MNVQASIKVLPTNYESRSDNYKLVDEALLIIKNSNMKYLIGPSETTLQGDFDEIIEIVKKIQNHYYNNKVQTFSINLSFEYNSENFYIDEKMNNVIKL